MAFNQIKGLSLKIDVFFFEHGTLFAFLTIFFLFISCVLFVRMLKRRFETLRLDRKYWVTLFILFVVVSGVYWSIASQRVFFSYEETDLKFFSDAITLSNSGEYRPVGTPRGGFFYLLIFIFNLFPFLREIGNLFFFIIISNYLTILLISFLVFDMFYSRFKGNNIISLLLSLTIVIYKPVLDAVWRYKLFYVIPTCGLFLAYYIFLRLKSLFKDRKRHMFKDKLLYSIFLLIVIYFISHTRPEFLVFSLPILFYSLPLYYREYKKSSSKQRVCYVLLFFLLFVVINLDVFSWYIFEPARRAEAGMMKFEISRYFGTDILSLFDWGSYCLLFILLFSKKTFLFGLVYVPFLTYLRFFTHMWDRFLYPFYIVFVLFLILREFSLFKKKKIYPVLVFVLILFISPFYPFDRPVIGPGLDYWRMPTDGSQILYLKEFLNNKSFIIYERWPSVFSEFVFSDSPSEFREFRRELDPRMSVFFKDGYSLTNISASYFLDMNRPVLFAHPGDISDYVVYLKDANMTFSRLINKSFYFNLYELHFEFNQTD